VLELLEDRVTPSRLIPVTGARDLVFDNARDLLYITTSAGRVERYDLGSNTLLTPWAVGTSLNGADITPAGDYLYAADTSSSVLRKVDLTTGQVTNISYSDGSGAWDVKVAANGKVLFDSRFAGSGYVNLYSLDPATGTLTNRRSVRQDTGIARGADRSRLFFQESNTSSGPIFTYDSASNSFSSGASTDRFIGNVPAAVSRDGSLIAMQYGGSVSVLDAQLHTIQVLPGGDGGLAFDPARDFLYALDTRTSQVVAYDTAHWDEHFRVDVGAAVGSGGLLGDGAITITPDGSEMFLISTAGVRQIDLPTEAGVVRWFYVSGFPSFTRPGAPGTFTVTALDALGNPVPDYQGTVQFSSTDPAADLPDSYTFTTADQGTHAFTATFQTTGTFTLTAQDVADPSVFGFEAGIRIHDNHVSLVPVANARATVYDPSRDILYISTSGGTVERYQVDTQTLLEPLYVGRSLNGLDISPDGGTLYVADTQPDPTQSMLRKVDLATGQVTNISYPGGSGAWDVKVVANGLVLFNSRFAGSGGLNLYAYDPVTGTLTNRQSVRQNTGFARGADRSRLFFQGDNGSNGPILTYDSATDSFPSSADTGTFIDGNAATAVSRNGSLIAMQFAGAISILDPSLHTIQIVGNGDGGLAFDPVRDFLYALDTRTAKVIAYDTHTWRERFRVDVGASIGGGGLLGNGAITITADGSEMFLITTAGVRKIDLPTETGVPRTLEVRGFPSFTGQGTAGTFTVTVRDAVGDVVPDYQGTVQFTTTDPLAGLPPSYTFTADDQGTHTFTAIFGTVGTFSLTAQDAADPTITGTESGIRIHDNHASLIPVTNRRGTVYDASRDILYISTSGGTVERYQVGSQTLLEPFYVGVSLNGLDISPDDNTLYVTEGQPGATQTLLRQVDLTTGEVSNLGYSDGSGGWNVAVAANGKVLFDSKFAGSGWVNLYAWDPTTGTLSSRRSVRQNTQIARGADRSRLFFMESNISSGPIFTYDSTTDSFPSAVDVGGFHDQDLASVSRDGALIAYKSGSSVVVRDPSLNVVHTLTSADGGVLFDPTRDILYVVNSATSQVIAYDTHTWAELSRIAVGETVGSASPLDNGVFTASSDGSTLFLSTRSGVRVISV
jgi:sugar lactone lactonase YvrE